MLLGCVYPWSLYITTFSPLSKGGTLVPETLDESPPDRKIFQKPWGLALKPEYVAHPFCKYPYPQLIRFTKSTSSVLQKQSDLELLVPCN